MWQEERSRAKGLYSTQPEQHKQSSPCELVWRRARRSLPTGLPRLSLDARVRRGTSRTETESDELDTPSFLKDL